MTDTTRMDALMRIAAEWREIEPREAARALIADGAIDDDFAAAAVENQVTEWVRKALKRRDKRGVPLFGSLTAATMDGRPGRAYKATRLFDDGDYRQVVNFHIRSAQRELKTAQVWADDASERYGVQLTIPVIVERAAA